jgi:hypothetical protein
MFDNQKFQQLSTPVDLERGDTLRQMMASATT